MQERMFFFNDNDEIVDAKVATKFIRLVDDDSGKRISETFGIMVVSNPT